MAQNMCSGSRLKGVAMCETHNVKLVDRQTLESLHLAREHPPVGNMFCPVSGQAISFSDDVDDFLTPDQANDKG